MREDRQYALIGPVVVLVEVRVLAVAGPDLPGSRDPGTPSGRLRHGSSSLGFLYGYPAGRLPTRRSAWQVVHADEHAAGIRQAANRQLRYPAGARPGWQVGLADTPLGLGQARQVRVVVTIGGRGRLDDLV